MTTLNDYRVLMSIVDADDDTKGISKLNGTTRAEIQQKTNISLSKIAQSLNKFMDEGLVEQGIGEGRTKKYIVTAAGMLILNELDTLKDLEK